MFTPNKLKTKSAPSCLDFAQVAMPIVHPTTSKTISSYKCLMHDKATANTWQTAFGKDFGSMAQGDNKTGQKGTNSLFTMTRAEIPHIPKAARSRMPASLLISAHKKQTPIKYGSLPKAISSIITVNFPPGPQT
jgi:hypothetical protein